MLHRLAMLILVSVFESENNSPSVLRVMDQFGMIQNTAYVAKHFVTYSYQDANQGQERPWKSKSV
jgi:hypothetical protein